MSHIDREKDISYHNLFKTMTLGVVYQNAAGAIISANLAAERILGLSFDQMTGRTSLDPRWKAIHEDGSDFSGETHPSMVALKTGKKVRDVIMGVFNPENKAYRWISINAIPQYRQGEQKPYQVYTTFEDITERRKIEEKLRENEEKFSNLFQHSNDAIFIHDIDGNIIDANQKTLDLFGYTKSELLSITVPMLHPNEALETSKWAFETIMREGYVRFIIKFSKKSGEVFPTEVSSSLFEIKGKKVIQGIVRDITDRKQGEEEREILIQHLKEALKEITTLRGILPICSFCKKIRDDKGYWEKVDVYIQKHTQADISHGVCPECLKEHYPDFDIRKN